jgi:dTDP-4-amino-4,6-dideoxygalactose transaminase
MNARSSKSVRIAVPSATRAALADPPPDRVPWLRPIFEPDDALLDDIRGALASGRVTNDGPAVREFERRLAAYLGVEDCVAVASGSAALLLSMWALGTRRGKAVLPSFTFIATANAVVQAGLTPVFCDIDPDTWTMSPAHLRQLLADDPSIALVLPVNVFGVLPDLGAITRAMRGSRAALLLDNAHGLGTAQGGRRCPTEAPIQAYSLHATKTLPAVEGGLVLAEDPRLLAEVRRLRNHGIAADPMTSSPGCNAKLSELHAAVGLSSLRSLDGVLARRRQYAERLRRVLREECAARFTPQAIPAALQSNFQNLGVVCRTDGRPDAAGVQAELEREGVETRRYFWPPLHRLPAYGAPAVLPVTDAVGDGILCLPLHSRMDAPTLERIETALRRVARHGA